MNQAPNQRILDLADRMRNAENDCGCCVCEPDGTLDAEVIRRGHDRYIVLNGRLLTYFGAPVDRNEPAEFYLHECLGHQAEDGLTASDLDAYYKDHLWPEKRGIFNAEDTVDLYRAIRTSRGG